MEIFKKTLLGILGVKSNRNRALGIDIGSSAVKLVEISSSEKGIRIEAYHVEPLPDDAVSMGKIVDHVTVTDAIKRGLASSRFRSKDNVSMVLPDSMVTIREITVFGNLSEEELEVRAYSEAIQITGSNIDDLAVDFCEDKKSSSGDQRKLLIVIAKKENVEDISQLATESGISPRILDVELYALHAMCTRFLNMHAALKAEGRICLFVEFGNAKTMFLFLRGQEIIFIKEQSFGFLSLVREVQSELDLDYMAAQRMIAGIDSSQERYTSRILPEFISECCAVVSRTLQLFYTTTSFVKIDAMFVFGGGSQLPGLSKAIQDEINVKVRPMISFSGEDVSTVVSVNRFFSDMSRLTTAIGIAIRNLLDDSV